MPKGENQGHKNPLESPSWICQKDGDPIYTTLTSTPMSWEMQNTHQPHPTNTHPQKNPPHCNPHCTPHPPPTHPRPQPHPNPTPDIRPPPPSTKPRPHASLAAEPLASTRLPGSGPWEPGAERPTAPRPSTCAQSRAL